MKILICDDEKLIAEEIRRMILDEFPEYSVTCICGIRDLPENADETFDVALLDIVLDDESGIDLGVYLRQKMPETRTIFISGYQSKVAEIFFSVSPFGFIDKPIKPEVLFRYLKMVKEDKNSLDACFAYTEKGHGKRIRYRDIIYVESNRERILINTVDYCFHVWKKLSEVEDDFPDYFVRCHKSYLVNMKYIRNYEKQIFTLVNGREISISRSKKNETEMKYFKFKGGLV